MKFNEFAIVEKKKRKRKKPRWAAYGPGPYGGYGYAAGYSGDGGGDGGVGEASYEGNVGMMEVAKFFQIANEAQKKLFKELLEKNKRGLAWKLIQDVTDTKLQGKEFEVEEGIKDSLVSLGISSAIAVGALAGMSIKQALTSPDVPTETKIKIIQQAELEKKDIPKLIAAVKKETPKVDTGDDDHGFNEPIKMIQVVEKGDTVYSISREHGLTPEDIRRVNKLDKDFTIKPGQELGIPAKSSQKEFTYKKSDTPSKASKTLYNNEDEKRLMQGLLANGIKGVELAAFMAQSAHETRNFEAMVEEGSPRYFLRYEKTSKNPDHKKSAKRLGNTEPGDGARFKGRGYLQITGRDNYTRVGKRIGVNLAKNPELLERPDVNLKASLAYWKMRTSSKVKNFNNVRAVTYTINPGLDKLDWRKEQFKDYKQLLALR
jgi:putative chitinase